MPDLKDLKKRLEKLPEKRKQSDLAAGYGNYIQKLGELCEKINQTYKDVENIEKVSSSKEYKNKVLSELGKIGRVVQKLYKEISGKQESVTLDAMEERIVNLGDIATTARNTCNKIWDKETKERVERWEKIAGGGNHLGTSDGREFKQVVDRLRGRLIPQNKEEVDKIKADKKKFEESIEKLGLKGPFGKFFNEAMSEEGASLKDLIKYVEIRNKLTEDDIWDSFRIRFLK